MNTISHALMDTCKTCNIKFVSRDQDPFCSVHCREVNIAFQDKETLLCPQCGNPYKVTSPSNRFCTTRCAGHNKRGVPPSARRCLTCNKVYKFHNYRQRFCSTDCRNAFHNPRKTPLIKYCLECAKPFRPYRPNQKCCSATCSFQHQKTLDRIRYDTQKALTARRQ